MKKFILYSVFAFYLIITAYLAAYFTELFPNPAGGLIFLVTLIISISMIGARLKNWAQGDGQKKSSLEES